MIAVSEDAKTLLSELGSIIRVERIKRNDKQSDFAARMGVSIPTLRKIESGNPKTLIQDWLRALELVGRLDILRLLTTHQPEESLFNLAKRRDALSRQRVRKKANR